MPAQTDAEAAIAAIEASGFEVNTHWETAHEIAQNHEGECVFDAIHALCHRIEGDLGNAAYWDRRAGTGFGGQGFAAEFEQVKSLVRE